MTHTIEKEIEVNVPISIAYNQWTQFEEFPQFMSGVQSVQQLDDTHLHWRAEILGVEREWDAEIVQQSPDQSVAWRAIGGTKNDGTVTFTERGVDRCLVRVRMEIEPEGFVEQAGDKLGFIGQRVEGDLQRFKEFIESRGTETGAWRGEVYPGETQSGMGAEVGAGSTVGSTAGTGSLGTTSGGGLGTAGDLGASSGPTGGMGTGGTGGTGTGGGQIR